MDEIKNFVEEKPNSLLRGIRVSNVKRVAESVYFSQKPLTVKEISKLTGLSDKQIWKAINFLSKLNSVTKQYVIGQARHLRPPLKTLKISLNKSQTAKLKRFVDNDRV